jgi:hypothetical protein
MLDPVTFNKYSSDGGEDHWPSTLAAVRADPFGYSRRKSANGDHRSSRPQRTHVTNRFKTQKRNAPISCIFPPPERNPRVEVYRRRKMGKLNVK